MVCQERAFTLQLTIKVCSILSGKAKWELTKLCQNTGDKQKTTPGSRIMDSRCLSALSRERRAWRPPSSSLLPQVCSSRILRKESGSWNTIFFSVLKGTVTEGSATDELLKELLHQYWELSHKAASQLLFLLWTVRWVGCMEACRPLGLDQDVHAPKAS